MSAATHPTIVQLANQVDILEDGWAMLAPFGDFPGVALTNDGPRPAVQRVDREAGEALARSLKGFAGKASRFFRGVPIFAGHPDVPQLAHRYSDPEPKGTVADLQVRDTGIFIRPVLTEAGADLVNSGEKLGFSAYVRADVIGSSDDKLVTRWNRLNSAALTQHPNLPVELVNSKQPEAMSNPIIIAAIVAAGVQIANEASEAAIAQSIRSIAEERTKATQLANERATQITALTERATQAETTLANERAERVKELLDERVTSGAITEAERAVWERRLKADFSNEAPSLRDLGVRLHTHSRTAGNGDRKSASSSGKSTVDLINEAVAGVRQAQPGLSYQEAYAAACRQNPTLFTRSE